MKIIPGVFLFPLIYVIFPMPRLPCQLMTPLYNKTSKHPRRAALLFDETKVSEIGKSSQAPTATSSALVAGVAAAPQAFTSTAMLFHPSWGNRQQSRAPARTG
jgi:hypothetical protein